MFKKNKTITIGTFSEVNKCKRLFGTKESFESVCELAQECYLDEVVEFTDEYPKADADTIRLMVNNKNMVRWCDEHKAVVNLCAFIAPAFALYLFRVTPGTIAFDWLMAPHSGFTAIDECVLTAGEFLNPAIEVAAKGAGASFFAGKGVILLHMLLVGFFTLVVSSFLKFTGRADFIPLVAFVGGGVILYEVINLFYDIYAATAKLLRM